MLKGKKPLLIACLVSSLVLLVGCGGDVITSATPSIEASLYLNVGDEQKFEVTGTFTSGTNSWIITKYYRDAEHVSESVAASRSANGAFNYEFIATEPDRDDLYLTKVRFENRKVVCPLPVNECIASMDRTWFIHTDADKQYYPVWEGSFAINNPNDVSRLSGFTEINGDLFINDSNGLLKHLDGLSDLRRISRDLVIEGHTSLTRLDSLSNIHFVGRNLMVRFNESLADFNGLGNLRSVGDYLSVSGNTLLADLDWLGNLDSLGGSLNLLNNNALTNLDGLTNLTSIEGSLSIDGNASLQNIEGLSNVSTIGSYLEVSGSPLLTNLRGLQGITSIGESLRITKNRSITHLDELGNLLFVGGGLTLTNNDQLQNIEGLYNLQRLDGLYLFRNHSLSSLNGLNNVSFMGGSVNITMNDALFDLRGLGNIASVEGDLGITDNPSLPTCEAEFLLGLIGSENIEGRVTIANNNDGISCD